MHSQASAMLLCVFFALAGIGSFVSGSRRFPDSFRVEVELINFVNNHSIDYLNRYCDSTTQCDTRISAYMDLETSLKPHTPHWQTHKLIKVFEVDNTDSPKINKVVSKDVCGGGLNVATLRAYVHDADVSYRRATIDEFDCSFRLHIAESSEAATYGYPIECEAHYRGGDHKLFARARAYRTNDANCMAGGENSTVSVDWVRQQNAATLQGGNFNADQPMRIEFQPVNLQNPRGVTFSGQPCETNNAPCQPLLLVKLDTDNSMSATSWNDNSRFAFLAKYADVNSPRMGADVVHDICGGELDWINLRVIVKHAPTWHEGKLKWHEYKTIEEFDCPTRFAYHMAGTNDKADWGPIHDCFPRHQYSGMRLDFRIRAYPISLEQCNTRDRLGQDAVRERAAAAAKEAAKEAAKAAAAVAEQTRQYAHRAQAALTG